jgi:hypothetical protein
LDRARPGFRKSCRALKSYSFLGQAPVQWIDLHEGLDNYGSSSCAISSKAGIDVHRDYAADLPLIHCLRQAN